MLTVDTRATTDVDRYACLARYQERLRLMHNVQGARVGQRGGIDLAEFQEWERKTWRPRLQHVLYARELYRPEVEKLPAYRKPASELKVSPISLLKQSSRADEKWDASFDLQAIEPMGRGFSPVDPVQDFTTWTEVDPGGQLSETATRCTYTNLIRNQITYLYKDFGAAHFAGDWEWLLTSTVSSGDALGLGTIIAVTNALGDLSALAVPSCYYYYYNYTGVYTLTQFAGSTVSDATANLGRVTHYLRMVRDESVGTYGTLYMYIYSDSGRTTLVDTLAVTLVTAKYDFRYLEVAASYNSANAAKITGYVENLDLQEATLPLFLEGGMLRGGFQEMSMGL